MLFGSRYNENEDAYFPEMSTVDSCQKLGLMTINISHQIVKKAYKRIAYTITMENAETNLSLIHHDEYVSEWCT